VADWSWQHAGNLRVRRLNPSGSSFQATFDPRLPKNNNKRFLAKNSVPLMYKKNWQGTLKKPPKKFFLESLMMSLSAE